MKPGSRIDLSICTVGCTVERIEQNPQDESLYRRLMGGNVRWASPRSAPTAQSDSSPLGWAEIRHPFHPLRGESFLILKQRRVAGVDTLVLRGLERGSFSVARDWTDRADPCPYQALGLLPRFDVTLLLELAKLLEQLAQSAPKQSPKYLPTEIDK